MTLLTRLWPLAAWLLRLSLPYPDPLRRCRARRRAMSLVTCEPWPEDDASQLDVAEILLVRLLWLQRATRRSLCLRQHDAAALLTRAAVETCIAGLYWLFGNADMELIRAQNAKSLHRVLMPFATEDLLSPALVDEVAAAMSSTRAEPPKLANMANTVAQATGHSVASDLYKRLYVPLSTLYAHPTGAAFERHVGRSRRLKRRPARGWGARSMRHAVDACAGILAVAVAQHSGIDDELLAAYADAHMKRTIAPIVSIGGRAVLVNLRPSGLRRALSSLRQLIDYYDSGAASLDAEPLRKKRTEQHYEDMLNAVGADGEPYRQLLLEGFAELTNRLVSADGDAAPGPEPDPHGHRR